MLNVEWWNITLIVLGAALLLRPVLSRDRKSKADGSAVRQSTVSSLLRDAKLIRDRLQWIIENYDWPPAVESASGKQVVVRPLKRSGYTEPIFQELRLIRVRLEDHNRLVHDVLSSHGVQAVQALDPDQMHQATMLTALTEYLRVLEELAK